MQKLTFTNSLYNLLSDFKEVSTSTFESRFLALMALLIIIGLVQQYISGVYRQVIPAQAVINDGLAGNWRVRLVKQMALAKNAESSEQKRHQLFEQCRSRIVQPQPTH